MCNSYQQLRRSSIFTCVVSYNCFIKSWAASSSTYNSNDRLIALWRKSMEYPQCDFVRRTTSVELLMAIIFDTPASAKAYPRSIKFHLLKFESTLYWFNCAKFDIFNIIFYYTCRSFRMTGHYYNKLDFTLCWFYFITHKIRCMSKEIYLAIASCNKIFQSDGIYPMGTTWVILESQIRLRAMASVMKHLHKSTSKISFDLSFVMLDGTCLRSNTKNDSAVIKNLAAFADDFDQSLDSYRGNLDLHFL